MAELTNGVNWLASGKPCTNCYSGGHHAGRNDCPHDMFAGKSNYAIVTECGFMSVLSVFMIVSQGVL